MTRTSQISKPNLLTPSELFWAECRRQAEILNIPAWKLAEELYQHGVLDESDSTK
jgi:hypothetical protein